MSESDDNLTKLATAADLLNVGLPAAYDNINDAMFVVGKDGRIIYCNKGATTLFGYAIAEMLGQPIEMLVPDDVRPRHNALRDSFVAHPSTRRMAERSVIRGRHKSGETFEAKVGLSYVDTRIGVLPVAQVRIAESQS